MVCPASFRVWPSRTNLTARQRSYDRRLSVVVIAFSNSRIWRSVSMFPTPQVFSLVYAYRRKNECNLTQFIYVMLVFYTSKVSVKNMGLLFLKYQKIAIGLLSFFYGKMTQIYEDVEKNHF